jgi:hypothetical protein
MLQHEMHSPGSSSQNADFLVEEPCRRQVEADASREILRATEALQDDRIFGFAVNLSYVMNNPGPEGRNKDSPA